MGYSWTPLHVKGRHFKVESISILKQNVQYVLGLFQLERNLSIIYGLLIDHKIIFVFPLCGVVLLIFTVNYSLNCSPFVIV